jgi:para-nitrobenzyl esterase
MRLWAGFNAALQQPTWLYFMSYVPPAFQLYLADDPRLELPGGPRSGGAYHSGDLAYVFNNVGRVGAYWQAEDFEIARIMSGYWTNFARTGNPNGPGLPAWRAYDPAEHYTQQIDTVTATIKGARRARLDLLQRGLR